MAGRPEGIARDRGTSSAGTQGEAADWLGITEGEIGRVRSRLGQLAKSFLSGEPVPKQRRPYKKRGGGKTNQFPFPAIGGQTS